MTGATSKLTIAYVVIAALVWFSLCVEAEYRKLQSGKNTDMSHVFGASLFWPYALAVFALIALWKRISIMPSRVALILHNRARVRGFARAIRVDEPDGYRDAGRGSP